MNSNLLWYYYNLTFFAKSVKLIIIYINNKTNRILNSNFKNSINILPKGSLILPIVTLYLSSSFKSGIPSLSKSMENNGSINKSLNDFRKLLVWLPNIHTISDVITVVFIIKFLTVVFLF